MHRNCTEFVGWGSYFPEEVRYQSANAEQWNPARLSSSVPRHKASMEGHRHSCFLSWKVSVLPDSFSSQGQRLTVFSSSAVQSPVVCFEWLVGLKKGKVNAPVCMRSMQQESGVSGVSQWLQAIHTRAYRKAVLKRLGSEHSRQDSSLSLKTRGHDWNSSSVRAGGYEPWLPSSQMCACIGATGEFMCDCREAMDVSWHLYEEESGGWMTGEGMYIPLWP